MKLDADCRSKNERQGPGGAAECRSPCVRARMGSSFAASRRWRMDSVDMNLAPGDVMSSYDYIVIGAGSSGCIVASRLRSAERRVGQGCVCTFSSRWSPYHEKKTKNNNK